MYFRTTVFCVFLSVLASFALTAETYFEVVDYEENNLIGTITALNETQISILVQDSSYTIPLNKLIKIRNAEQSNQISSPTDFQDLFQRIPSASMSTARGENERQIAASLQAQQSKEQNGPKTLPSNVIVLELTDGSRLTASSFTVENNQGIFRLLGKQNDLSLPLNLITAVRFVVRGLSEIVDPPADWLRLATTRTDGDKLVVGNTGSFDVYTGILNNITADTIAFSIDGEVLPVPRRKVFGLVLHNQPSSTTAPPLALLSLRSGTKAAVSNILLSGNALDCQTVSGLHIEIPLDMIEEINFSAKGIATLDDLELVHSEMSLPFETNINPKQLPLLKTFYENRTKNLQNNAVMDGAVFEKSITLRGKTLLEYRLSKSFVSLKAVIGIEDQYRPFAAGTLKVLADSQMLGTWELRGDEVSTRIEVNLPQSCRLLTIITDSLPQSNIPTVVTIGDLKLFE